MSRPSKWLRLEAFVMVEDDSVRCVPTYHSIATALLNAGFMVVDDISVKWLSEPAIEPGVPGESV